MVANSKVTGGKNTKLIGGIAAVVVVALGVIAGVPYATASSWKSSALDATNGAVDGINTTNRDISTYSNKLQPSEDDYAKLAAACEAQNVAVKKGKDELKQIGGFAGLDLTGTYKKATDTRAKLVSAYDELTNLNNACANRAKANKEVAVTMAKIQGFDSPEQAKDAAKALREAAAQITTFANTADGTQFDKDFATALNELAAGIEQMVAADAVQNEAAFNAGLDAVDSAAAKLDAIDAKSNDEVQAMQKKSDDIVARLNVAAKELE